MKRAFSLLRAVADFGSVASLCGIILVVALQVFARFFLDQAPSWTEEAARVFFLYLVGCGLAGAVRDDALVQLDMIKSILPAKTERALQIGIYAATTAFAVLLVSYAWQFTQSGAYETSPSLALPMSLLFASVLVMSLSILLFSLEKLIAAALPSRFR